MVNTINDIDNFNGPSPTVYHRVKQSDISIIPFPAYKLWRFNSGSATSSVVPLTAIYESGLPQINSNTFIGSTNINGTYQFQIYNSINHLFYKYSDQPYNTFGQNDITRTKKALYQSASVFSIPQNKIGEGVKLESFELTGNLYPSIYGSGSYGASSYGGSTKTFRIQSDRYGNLYETDYPTGSIVDGVKWYEGFNEYFDTNRIEYVSEGVTYTSGVPTTTGLTQSVGLAAKFQGAGYIESELKGYYDRDHDYAVSFFVSGANAGGSNQLILGKVDSLTSSSKWPFKIELSGSNQLIFSAKASDTLMAQITSSAVVSDWSHVVCQKTGSVLEMYVDGTLESYVTSSTLINSNGTQTVTAKINNDDPLKIGGYSANSGNLNGDLDEIRIFNKGLTTTNISALSDRSEGGTFLQTQYVGNIFEKQGIAVISSLDYRYDSLLQTDYSASYRSTVTIHEFSTIVRVNMGDLNVSQNKTLLLDDEQTVKSFATGSVFSPYITTIGLYNDQGQLLAIGKLGQPVKKRNDVDVNFLVRIDLDKNLPAKI